MVRRQTIRQRQQHHQQQPHKKTKTTAASKRQTELPAEDAQFFVEELCRWIREEANRTSPSAVDGQVMVLLCKVLADAASASAEEE